MERFELHTHSTLSDGELLPTELVRRAQAAGVTAIAVTDHAGYENAAFVVETLLRLVERSGFEGIEVFCGVEITHVPPGRILPLAEEIKAMGPVLVAVHGETMVEPVAPGTNRAAVEGAGLVDVLAHPGLITLDEARAAARNGVALEITSRRGHCLTNGHVWRTAREAGARVVVNSDAHEASDILDARGAERVLLGAGAPKEALDAVLFENPRAVLAAVRRKDSQ